MERVQASLGRLAIFSLLLIIIPIFALSYVRGATKQKKVLAAKIEPSATPTAVPTPTDTPTPIPLPTVTPTPHPTVAPTQTSTPAPTVNPTDDSVWDKIAWCESHQNWGDDTGNGYYGGLQFSLGAWNSVGGAGKPSDASRDEQIMRGKMLQSARGWSAWGACSHSLGLY